MNTKVKLKLPQINARNKRHRYFHMFRALRTIKPSSIALNTRIYSANHLLKHENVFGGTEIRRSFSDLSKHGNVLGGTDITPESLKAFEAWHEALDAVTKQGKDSSEVNNKQPSTDFWPYFLGQIVGQNVFHYFSWITTFA